MKTASRARFTSMFHLILTGLPSHTADETRVRDQIFRFYINLENSLRICYYIALVHFISRISIVSYGIVYFQPFELLILFKCCLLLCKHWATFNVYFNFDGNFRIIYNLHDEYISQRQCGWVQPELWLFYLFHPLRLLD